MNKYTNVFFAKSTFSNPVTSINILRFSFWAIPKFMWGDKLPNLGEMIVPQSSYPSQVCGLAIGPESATQTCFLLFMLWVCRWFLHLHEKKWKSFFMKNGTGKSDLMMSNKPEQNFAISKLRNQYPVPLFWQLAWEPSSFFLDRKSWNFASQRSERFIGSWKLDVKIDANGHRHVFQTMEGSFAVFLFVRKPNHHQFEISLLQPRFPMGIKKMQKPQVQSDHTAHTLLCGPTFRWI